MLPKFLILAAIFAMIDAEQATSQQKGTRSRNPHGPDTLLDSPSGQDALDVLFPEAPHTLPLPSAGENPVEPRREIEKHFLQNKHMRLDTFWQIPSITSYKAFYADTAPIDPTEKLNRNTNQNYLQTSSSNVAQSQRSVDAFALHSRVTAMKSIYLDFTGHNISGTAWNDQQPMIVAPPFDNDGDPNTFSSSELAIITEVWQRVSEDFAPFDIDVTTEYPGSEDFLTRSSSSDTCYGIRVLISPISAKICSSCGGIAYVDVFADIGDCSRRFLLLHVT
jgi:hypothetical protein